MAQAEGRRAAVLRGSRYLKRKETNYPLRG